MRYDLSNVVLLRRKCPRCVGAGYLPTADYQPEICALCESLGTVSPKEAADWERARKTKRDAAVLP